MVKDYYKILGVSREATKKDIKKAYKKLAKKYHPDLNKEPGAEEKFKEINEAASVLADEKKKAQYDRFGKTAQDFGYGAGFDFKDVFSEFGFGAFDFGRIFDEFFGRGFRTRGPSRGADLAYRLEIDLENAAFGDKKTIIVPRHETCTKCNGSGAESKTDIKKCDECNGSGYIRRTSRTPFGLFSTTSPCNKCRGQGTYIKKLCPVCDGQGRERKTRKISVKIPKGVATGSRLRIKGEGEAGEKDAPNGDLYVIIRVKPHDTFERDGNDIYIETPISFVTAALGGEIQVPTLDGKAKLKIPSGTQDNTVFRMKGKGIPDLETGRRGAQKVKATIEVPKRLNRKQKAALKEYAKASKEKGILSRIL